LLLSMAAPLVTSSSSTNNYRLQLVASSDASGIKLPNIDAVIGKCIASV